MSHPPQPNTSRDEIRPATISKATFKLLDTLRVRLGLDTDVQALAVLDHALERLGELLPPRSRRLLAERLDPALATALERATPDPSLQLDEMLERIHHRQGVPVGFALEHLQVACQVLAERLDPEVVTLMRGHLPEWAADLLIAQPRGHADRAWRAHGGHHLADGRPGSSRPLAEATTDGAHSHSVARNPSPHADTRLSTTHGPAPSTGTLAEGKPGASRALSDYHGD